MATSPKADCGKMCWISWECGWFYCFIGIYFKFVYNKFNQLDLNTFYRFKYWDWCQHFFPRIIQHILKPFKILQISLKSWKFCSYYFFSTKKCRTHDMQMKTRCHVFYIFPHFCVLDLSGKKNPNDKIRNFMIKNI